MKTDFCSINLKEENLQAAYYQKILDHVHFQMITVISMDELNMRRMLIDPMYEISAFEVDF